MSEVTVNGIPLSELPVAAASEDDPNSNMSGDREFMELLRKGKFGEAQRRFPKLYTNLHVGFLCRLTGQPAAADEQGDITPLTDSQFLAAISYIEGPMRQE